VIQEARASDTEGGILAEMPDGETSDVAGGATAAGASAALALLTEMSPDLRGGAILAADGSVLAANGDVSRWSEDVGALLDVADRADQWPVEQVHIATEQGEVFALRHAGLVAVAVTDRFALASLLFFDMRSVLRELAAEGR
jgi:predicted regulator of Ras-like GTPase activity (Roadblock/LC7/MglB family)